MQQNEKTPWQYKPDDNAAAAPPSNEGPPAAAPKRQPAKVVKWEAAEFIDHHHGSGWYGSLVVVTIILAAAAFLIAKDIFATVVVVLVGGIVWVYAGQKPGKAKYEITPSGININGKLYRFGNYKSFTVVRGGVQPSINLFPLKRLMPPLSAFFDPSDEQKIVEALGNYLPYDNRKLDNIDRLARILRL